MIIIIYINLHIDYHIIIAIKDIVRFLFIYFDFTLNKKTTFERSSEEENLIYRIEINT